MFTFLSRQLIRPISVNVRSFHNWPRENLRNALVSLSEEDKDYPGEGLKECVITTHKDPALSFVGTKFMSRDECEKLVMKTLRDIKKYWLKECKRPTKGHPEHDIASIIL